MSAQIIKQNAVYIGVAILVFIVLWLVTPSLQFEPKGIILPATNQPLVPSTKAVKLYQTMPYGAKPLAYINLELHSTKPTNSEQQQIFNKALKMTQQAGGGGLVINVFGYEGASSENPAPLAKYVLNATVIKSE